jgi:hypothetical protein
VITTHNYETVAFITTCYKLHGRTDLTIITSARELEKVYTSLFYEKYYYARDEVVGKSTAEKVEWYVDHVSVQLGPMKSRASELAGLTDFEKNKRNSRKCSFFSDLALLVTPSMKMSADEGKWDYTDVGKAARQLYKYDADRGYALLKKGALHEFNVLALKIESSSKWGDIIRTLKGWGDYTMCEETMNSASDKFMYQTVKAGLAHALSPETNEQMRFCDTYAIFYPERLHLT